MHIRPMRPDDAEQVFALRVNAFSAATHATHDADEIYIPDEHRLVAVDGDRVVGHLGAWPFHQAFLDRVVPMGGLGAVAVAYDQRGAGIGSRLLAAGLDHMADAGMVISTLYPSTPVPYRRWGWEFAGEHVRRRLPTRALLDVPAPATKVRLRPYEPDDLDALATLQDQVAAGEPGGLLGGRRWLARALQVDPEEPELAVVAVRDGRPAGLLLAAKTPPDGGIYGVHVLRMFGVDRDVERALLRSVGHHHTIADTTVLRSRPADPLLFELDSLTRSEPGSEHFMTRLVDAPRAIAARGWPPVSVTVELEITDDRRPANHGRFVLEVHDREASLTPGGAGRATVDVGALASLYTGFATAGGLIRAGRLRAGADDATALTDAFTAPAPFMRDAY
ncbi:MAG TPA: GNAT family N-acetyltransferase [Euzebyales bacterium]|nr:GNAT family N-acetyltransferase [Euzebyales bacterium]